MRRNALTAAALAAVLILTGCASASPAPTPKPAASESGAPSNKPVGEAEPGAVTLPSCAEFGALSEDDAIRTIASATGLALDENSGNELLNGVWFACDATPDRPLSEIIEELTGGQVHADEAPDSPEEARHVSSTQIGGVTFPGRAADSA